MKRWLWIGVILVVVTMVSACAGTPAARGDKLNVVATTTIVGDVVKQVGGDTVVLTVLLPVGTDPHTFDPSPQDMATVADAGVVFANGAGLEAFLDRLLENAGGDADVIHVSEGITFIETEHHKDEEESDADEHAHEGVDPHTWTDPNNVLQWVDNIEAALVRLDPAHAADYKANAEAYRAQLRDLDAWVREQVGAIPAENRKLVTDHETFAYFAQRYGFEQVGAIVPGYSTAAQPSAQDLAGLEDHIKTYGVKAVFVGSTVNPALAQRVAEDTGVKLISLYTGSLTEPGGEADSYLSYVKYNVGAMVEGLR
ncbi:MAG: zinc ABC transporter substrate-binding protein [Anaerolineae bacterium]|nr:zinc ABC transporter substrate-binding protein [Anaerolineae bacterium]